MPESLWQKPGATLSHKKACKEFGLSEDEIIKAMKTGELQYRQNYAHGNPYFRVFRVEVTKGRVSQIHKRALQRMRETLPNVGRLDDYL